MESGGHVLSWAKGVFVLVIFALGGVMLAAGGLGLAPVASLAGLGALAFAAYERLRSGRFAVRTPGVVVLVGVLFLAWAGLSLLWSDFDRPANLLRTLSGAVLYTGFFLLCLTMEGAGRRLARAGVLLCVASAGIWFAFELASGGAVTGAFRAPDPDPEQIWRNLGHGLSAWVLLLPGALLVLPWRTRLAKVVGVGLVVVGVAAAAAWLNSNLLGLLAAAVGGAAAWFWPRRAAWGVGGLTALSLLFAPALGLLARATPDGVQSLLPLSWEHRLLAWSYAADRIAERPLAGWGFDASRTMTETIDYAGEELQALPLHPHNAGLHLWLETGFVGAALAAALTLLVARAVAKAPGLTRVQAVAAVAAGAGYAAMAQVSYGVWQEWWVAVIAWAAVAAALTGPERARAPA
jgi:O-antigen ligase